MSRSNSLMKRTAIDGAYLKGVTAGLAGDPVDACPYDDRRKLCGRLTWSRAFRTAWFDGWNYARDNREQALITAKHAKYAKRPERKIRIR